MPKQLLFREESRAALLRGVNIEPPLGFTMVQTADLSNWSGGDREHPEWRRLIEQAHALVGGSRPAATMPRRPPRRNLRLMHLSRRHFTIAAAVVAALATGGLAIQRSCDETSRDGRSGSSETSGNSAATRVPRDVPAPSVSEGQHSSFAEARPLTLGVAEPGELFTASMKGPFESRHTSSERARSTAREHARPTGHPGARSELVGRAPRTGVCRFRRCSTARLLRAPDV